MKMRTGNKREALGRLFVLGGFSLVTPSRAPGVDTDEVNAPLGGEEESGKTALILDVREALRNATAKSRPQADERQAIERGENEGMMIGRE